MTSDRRRRAWADIDLAALRDNLAQVRKHNPNATLNPIVKSNAYGHGVEEVARTLADGGIEVARLAVATFDEAVQLNLLGTGKPILLLQGGAEADQLRFLVEAGVEMVVHADYQLQLLKQVLRDTVPVTPLTLWLKVDTGMHRLGVNPGEAATVYQALLKLPAVGRVILMSHLACADELGDAAATGRTDAQLASFSKVHADLEKGSGRQLARSLAASAGILAWPTTHFEHLRPGIMLYGGSPFTDRTGTELGLRQVMTLRSRLIAIKEVAAGNSIGYGATYTCDRNTRIGVVAIGYGDGYPRSAPTGTPVLVRTADGYVRTCLLGRVAMDMITIDLRGLDDTEVGDEVVLWGEGLTADEVARFAGTISYELFCRVTNRVPRLYG